MNYINPRTLSHQDMEMNTMSSNKMREREERRYSVPHGPNAPLPLAASEDLHAWSIYRQNLNSDFTDSALGSSDKSPLPYGNFQLRDTTVQSILNHPRYGPNNFYDNAHRSPLGSNMYTYLKFGLPRVFPPNAGSQRSGNNHRQDGGGGGGGGHGRGGQGRGGHINRAYRENSGPAAGSSGYDSSDNETTRGRVPTNLRKFRSESDFRHMGNGGGGGGVSSVPPPPVTGNNVPLVALRIANSRASIAGTHINHYSQQNGGNGYSTGGGKHYGNRSHSEADLLGNDMTGYDYELGNTFHSRSARHESQQQQQHLQQQQQQQQQQHTMSRRQSSMGGLVYPNIQVHCLDTLPSLRGISLQAKAGELFAVMATSQREGTILMETLAGLRERVAGEILINGQHITQRGLRNLCSFVASPEKSSLDARMSVQSTLSFHAALCGPMNKSDLSERVDILVEDLGLTAVRTTNVSQLTHSEKQRLSVACQLLTQASILILDQATTNMDIFDTFFLVEYLRQWCNSGRIVIMTLQPPTFEILSMCSGVLLLSGGRTVFSGSRSDLPRHMGSLGYPCPPFKNPADYYLDLVTLDDLSAAAMLESSARIESLANAWEQVNAEPSIASPPATLPNFTNHAGFFGQAMALSKRFIIYKQPDSLLAWISKLIAAAVLSLLIGCIFWDVPTTDPQLNFNDRLGYHHCMMVLGIWPLVLLTIRDIHDDRKYAERDIKLGLYGRTIYIFIQSLFNLLPSLCIWLAYLLPAHSMAGLYTYSAAGSDTGIYLYMGYMLLYLTVVQSIALFSTHLMVTKISSAILTMIIILAYNSVGGYVIHLSHLPFYWYWVQYVSPQRWLLPVLVADEYSQETLTNTAGQQLCRNKQVQHQEIIVQHPCPTPNGTQFLTDFMLLEQDHILDSSQMEVVTVGALVLASVAMFILAYFVFIVNIRRIFQKKVQKS